MATEIRLPQFSMGTTEGTVAHWIKKVGEAVGKDEPVVEIETSKVTSEVSSESAGVLLKILVPEGETVPVRTVLCLVGSPDELTANGEAEKPASPPPNIQASLREVPGPIQTPPSVGQPAGPGVQVTPAARRMAKDHGLDLDQVKGTGPGGRITIEDVEQAVAAKATPPASPVQVQVTPVARKLAKDHNIDLSQLKGSGPGGRIVEQDVEAAIAAAKAPTGGPVASPAATMAETAQAFPFTGMRGAIAQHMFQSLQSTAQVTLVAEADVTELKDLRDKLKEEYDLTYTDLLLKAVTFALKEHPRLNGLVLEEGLQLSPEINLGMAVALAEGLIVPVVHNAGEKSLKEIAGETRQLAQKAREGKLIPGDVTGGTFTITNLGMFGIDAFTPIINLPEVAILGVGRIVEKPARLPNGFIWRQMLTLSLTFDHRAVDGAPAAAFLQAVVRQLENPAALAG